MLILIGIVFAARAALASTSPAAALARDVLDDVRACESDLAPAPLDPKRPPGDGAASVVTAARSGRVAIVTESHRLAPDGPVGVRFTLTKYVRPAKPTRFESHLWRNLLLSIVESSLATAELSTFDDPRVHVVPATVQRVKDRARISAAIWLDAAAVPEPALERVIAALREGEARAAALFDFDPGRDDSIAADRRARARVGELLDGWRAYADAPPTSVDDPELTSWTDLINRSKSRGTHIVGGAARHPAQLLTLIEPRRLTADAGVGVRLTLGRMLSEPTAGRFTVDLVRNQMLVVLDRALTAMGLRPFDDDRVLLGHAAAVAGVDGTLLTVPVWLDADRVPAGTIAGLVSRLHEEDVELARFLNP